MVSLYKVYMPSGESYISFYVIVWPEVFYSSDKRDCKDLGFDFDEAYEVIISCMKLQE